MTRAWLIGEDNPYSLDPAMALYPSPPNCAGWRLCHKVLGVSAEEYLASYRRMNLCGGDAWDTGTARHEAIAVLHRAELAANPPLVLLGRKVTSAFGLRYEPFTVVAPTVQQIVILPHPSGRSRTWNDPGSYERARQILRSVGAL